MPNAVMHRLVDGRWRVTDAPDDWVNDGRDHPEPKATDGIHEYEADAIRDYLERTAPRDPEDEVTGVDPDVDTASRDRD